MYHYLLSFVPLPPFLTTTCTPLSIPRLKVVVPLVLLQALQSEGQSVTTLLHLGVRLLEEDETDYIIQQGGWVSLSTQWRKP